MENPVYCDKGENTNKQPEWSDYQCHLFGSIGDGITWRPLKGKEPNWFWRWMQFICFGNKWGKDVCQIKEG